MKRRQFLLSTALPPGARPAGVPSFRAGFAERDITPEVGMEQPGNYYKIFHQKLHDPCKVRAAVFDDGAKRVAVVGVDALIVPRHLVVAVRNAVRDKCGLAPGAVLIGASHSHSSGPAGMVQPACSITHPPLKPRVWYPWSDHET